MITMVFTSLHTSKFFKEYSGIYCHVRNTDQSDPSRISTWSEIRLKSDFQKYVVVWMVRFQLVVFIIQVASWLWDDVWIRRVNRCVWMHSPVTFTVLKGQWVHVHIVHNVHSAVMFPTCMLSYSLMSSAPQREMSWDRISSFLSSLFTSTCKVLLYASHTGYF